MQFSTVKIWSCAILLISFLALATTLPKEYQLKTQIDTNSRFMTADHLLSSYIVDDKNQVMKYDSTGQLIGRLSDKRYGDITSVDVTSPFNILVFFKDFATIIATDNNLNPRTLYRLGSLGINEVGAAALGSDNNVWFFDLYDSRLKKINPKYEIMFQSPSINELLEIPINPSFITERDQKVYVCDPEVGIFVFDIFANYYNAFPITGIEQFQVLNNTIVYHQDGKLNLFNMQEMDVRTLPLPDSVGEIKSIHLEKDMLYVLNEEGLLLYESK